MKLIEAYNEVLYKQWKRANVMLRGITDLHADDNGGMAKYGQGLYLAPLSNRKMAAQYGDVYFVVGGKPKKPKKVRSVNEAEYFLQTIVADFCKQHNVKRSKYYFNENTTIADEMKKLGFDGLEISGRETVNYFPPDNVLYFETEHQLVNYYEHKIV